MKKQAIIAKPIIEVELGSPVQYFSFNDISQQNESQLGEVREVLADGRLRIKHYGTTLIETVPATNVEKLLARKPWWA